MRITYAFDNPMPSTKTDTEQLANTVAALARRGLSVDLLLPAQGAGPTADEIRRYYQVTGDFTVSLFPPTSTDRRTVQQVLHARRIASGPYLNGSDVVYTRQLVIVAQALREGHRVAFEHYRPFGDQYPPVQPLLRTMMRHPRFVGAILHSEHARRSFERIGVPPERLLVAHNGYDPERMEPRLSTVEARAALGLPEQPTVAYSGRVQMSKGLDIVLEMATRCPEIHFLLVGSEGEGEVERHARRLPNVTVVPWQKFDRTVRYLYAADVLLLPPSLGPLAVGNTVLPMKLFLYLAAGRALLAPKAPDTEELLVHGSNSRLVEPGDAEVASDALRALVEDHETRQRLAEGAFETGKGLTWDARASRIEAFLAERLAQGGETPAKDPWSTVTWLKESARWLVEKR